MTPHAARHPHDQTRARRQRADGFTLIELLVAISIVSGIVFLFSQVFSSAQESVARGAFVSQAISQTQALEEQVFEDAAAMLVFEDEVNRPGENPGFLVIVQHRTPDPVEFPEGSVQAYDYDAQAAAAGEYYPDTVDAPIERWPRRIRSDQLVFFRSAADLEALTPGSDERLDAAASAAVARVWYGHLSRITLANTADPIGQGVNLTTDDLILGRQALFVINPATETTPNAPAPGAFNSDNVAIPPSGGWTPTSEVFEFPILSRLDANTDELWKGGADALALVRPGSPGVDFAELFDNPSAYPNLYGELVDQPSSPAEVDDGLSFPQYQASAMSWAFPQPNRRLLAQTEVDILDAAGAQSGNIAEQVARLHAVLSPYVSDFIVEFAADITDDIGTDSGGTQLRRRGENGFIADGLPDGEPDIVLIGDGDPNGVRVRDNNELAGLIGSIRWYTAKRFAYCPGDFGPLTPDTPFDIGNITEPVVWPVPGSGYETSLRADTIRDLANFYEAAGTTAPATIFSGEAITPALNATPTPGAFGPQQDRTQAVGSNPVVSAALQKYPPLVPETVIATNSYDAADVAFVWGHGGNTPSNGIDTIIEGDGKYWPYMIRIRYRLHDPGARFGSVDPASANSDNPRTINGRWYEIIIPVPR